MTLVGGISTVVIKTVDEVIGHWAGLDRSGQICRQVTGRAYPYHRRTGSSTPGRPRHLEGGSSAQPKTPDSGRNASSDVNSN